MQSGGSKVDIGIIVDASVDAKADFKKLKSFIIKLSSKFDISINGARAGIILFNNDVLLEAALSDSRSNTDFQNVINSLQMLRGSPRISKAFEMADNKLFTVSNGMRRDVPKVLLLLLGSKVVDSLSTFDMNKLTKPLYDKGIKVSCFIGVCVCMCM